MLCPKNSGTIAFERPSSPCAQRESYVRAESAAVLAEQLQLGARAPLWQETMQRAYRGPRFTGMPFFPIGRHTQSKEMEAQIRSTLL